jgi:hypothetical protein
MSSYVPGFPETFAPDGFFPSPSSDGAGLYPVWPIRPQLTLHIRKNFASVVDDLGDGFELRKNNNETYTHADGQGGVSSHKGQWEFQVQINGIDQADVNTLWQFITARGGNLEPFYFYNPIEASIDLTGSATTGRYLVRLKDPMASLEAFALKLHRGQFSLVEVRA